MYYFIILGIFNIIASLGFVAWSEVSPRPHRERKVPKGLSHGQLTLLGSIVSYSKCEEV